MQACGLLTSLSFHLSTHQGKKRNTSIWQFHQASIWRQARKGKERADYIYLVICLHKNCQQLSIFLNQIHYLTFKIASLRLWTHSKNLTGSALLAFHSLVIEWSSPFKVLTIPNPISANIFASFSQDALVTSMLLEHPGRIPALTSPWALTSNASSIMYYKRTLLFMVLIYLPAGTSSSGILTTIAFEHVQLLSCMPMWWSLQIPSSFAFLLHV